MGGSQPGLGVNTPTLAAVFGGPGRASSPHPSPVRCLAYTVSSPLAIPSTLLEDKSAWLFITLGSMEEQRGMGGRRRRTPKSELNFFEEDPKMQPLSFPLLGGDRSKDHLLCLSFHPSMFYLGSRGRTVARNP